MKKQNTSTAVMAQRYEDDGGVDYYPTPAWGTRALCEHVINIEEMKVLEPACGEGHMSEALKPYCRSVYSSDLVDYGYGASVDYLKKTFQNYDWIITNPPFNLAEEFIHKALKEARVGVAMLTRLSYIETKGRYNRLFSLNPPNIVAVFAERLALVKGRVDKDISSATSYAWLVWIKDKGRFDNNIMWIPPCRKELERDGDYE